MEPMTPATDPFGAPATIPDANDLIPEEAAEVPSVNPADPFQDLFGPNEATPPDDQPEMRKPAIEPEQAIPEPELESEPDAAAETILPEPKSQLPEPEYQFPETMPQVPAIPEPDFSDPAEAAPNFPQEDESMPSPMVDESLPSQVDVPSDQARDELNRELEDLEGRLGTPELTEDDETQRPAPGDDEDSAFADDEEDWNDEIACDRNYDERNCCEEEDDCRTAWDQLTGRRLRDIELDISPPFSPLTEDPSEAKQDRVERLAKAPSRQWRGRHGELLATGKLQDYLDGKIVVASSSGKRVTLPFLDLSHDDLCFVTAWWGLPGECAVMGNDSGIRDWRLCTFTWKASSLCHKPLYFEDVQLERYGHSAGPFLQPLSTTAHFFANVLLLPYNMGVYPPTECRYPLGHYRPGSCAPWIVPAFPISERGAKAQLITVLGIWGYSSPGLQ